MRTCSNKFDQIWMCCENYGDNSIIQKNMQYIAKNFDHLKDVDGLSDALITDHVTLYEGYVTNTNKLMFEAIPATEPGTLQYAELKRRFGWEWNGMRLHELYFGNMSADEYAREVNHDSELVKLLETMFGSFDAWKEDFAKTGAMRGIGWVVLAYEKEQKLLFNTWIGEHDLGHLAGATPLVVMDVFEHAYIRDYGLKRAEYIDVFMNVINWRVVEGRMA